MAIWNGKQLASMVGSWLKGEIIKQKKFEYSFADDTGAIGDITFGQLIPQNSVITRIETNETTALTSGGSATITIKAGSTSLTDAIAFDSGFTGYDNQALTGAATGIVITTNSALTWTIATAALTAGVVEVIVEYKLLRRT